jgi:hypothetical protein
MDEGIAGGDPVLVAWPVGSPLPSIDPPATTRRDLGLLLDVDVDQLAGVRGIDAPNNPSAATIEVRKTTHSVANKDPVQGRGGDTRSRGQAGRAELVFPAELHDPSLGTGRGLGWAPPGPAGAVLETSPTGLLVAPPPLVGGLAGDPHGLGGCRHRPTLLANQLTETESTFRGERSVTVHESLLGVVSV